MWDQVLTICNSRTGSSHVMAFNGVGAEPPTAELFELLAANGHALVLPRVEGDHIVAVRHRPGDDML